MRKSTLKALSIVLVLIMLLSVMPVNIFAANSPDAKLIKEVSIYGVHTPYAGYRPDYAGKLGSTSYTYDNQMENDSDVYNGKWWYDETSQKVVSPDSTFIEGHVYTFSILLVANTGYEFWVDNYNTPFISATVNGEPAVVYDDLTNKYNAFIEYTFEPCEYNYEISEIEVNVEEPVAGGYPEFDVDILTSGVSKDNPESPYYIESVAWYDCVNQTFLDPSHTFKEDGVYEVNIMLTTIGDYYFATENDKTDVKAVINGKEGESNTAGKNDKYHILISGVVFGDVREEVNSIKISDLNIPAVGENPDFSVTPVGNDFYINGIFWTDVTDSGNHFTLKETDTFEAGRKYELQVWVRANEDYKFRTDDDGYVDITAFVNDKQVEVVPAGSEISAEITCEFTMPQPVIIEIAKVTQVTPPVAGEKPDFTAFAYTDGMEITEVKWYDDTDNTGAELTADSTFAEGHTYRVVVSLKTLAGHKFLYFDGYNEAEGLINGEKAIAYGSHKDDTLELGYKFASCEKAPVTEPATDDEKPTEPSAPGETEPSKPVNPSSSDETEPSEPIVDKEILGDVDGNGKVNIKDATMIQKAVAKIISLTDAEQIRADVNADTKVNIKDATAIQKYVAKIETGLPIGEPAK